MQNWCIMVFWAFNCCFHKKKKFFKASVEVCFYMSPIFHIWIICSSFWNICHYTPATCCEVMRTCEIHLYSSTTFVNPLRNYLPFTPLPQSFIHSKGHTVLVTYRTGCWNLTTQMNGQGRGNSWLWPLRTIGLAEFIGSQCSKCCFQISPSKVSSEDRGHNWQQTKTAVIQR